MEELLTLLVAIAVIGYFAQRAIDRRASLAERRREAYANYLKSLFGGMDQAPDGRSVKPDEVYWGAQVVLYATDDVLEGIVRLQALIMFGKIRKYDDYAEIKAAYGALLCSMRKEIVRGTQASPDMIGFMVPIIK